MTRIETAPDGASVCATCGAEAYWQDCPEADPDVTPHNCQLGEACDRGWWVCIRCDAGEETDDA